MLQPLSFYISFIFGSDRSPRRGDLVCACVRASVCDIIQNMTLKEFLMHSKESRRVNAGLHACMLA